MNLLAPRARPRRRSRARSKEGRALAYEAPMFIRRRAEAEASRHALR